MTGRIKSTVTSKQLWQHIFAGQVEQAISITRHGRKSDTCQQELNNVIANALYFDPSLSSNSGHQLNISMAYACLAHELDYRFLVRHAYNASISRRQDWQPYFLVPHHTLAFRAIQTQQELMHVNDYFEYEFIDAISHCNPKLCIFATTRFTNIVAAARAVASAQTVTPTRIIFMVFEADDAPDCCNPNLIRSTFVEAASILLKHKIAYKISVETNYIRDFLLDCGFQAKNVHIYEYVAAKQITDGVRLIKRIDNRVRIGYLGGSRRVRNPEIIADLLLAQGIPRAILWCVQLNLKYIERTRGPQVVEKILALHEQGTIELYSGELSEQEYKTLFCSLDIIVMPYSERYQKIGSGILCEAIYAEIIPVIPENSSMNEMYISLGGDAPTFQTLSTTTLQQAIVDGVDRLPELKRVATHIQADWSQHPNSAKQWRRDILSWVSGVSKDCE